jgi:hypothetical protein
VRTDPEVARVVRSWLVEGVDRLPDRVLDSVLESVPATPQRRPMWAAWRLIAMPNLVKLLGAAAAILFVAVVGWRFLPSSGGIGAPAATVAPSPSPDGSSGPSASAPPAIHVADPFAMPFTITLPPGNTSRQVTEGEAQIDGTFGFVGVFVPQSVPHDPCHAPTVVPSERPGATPPSAAELVTDLTSMTGFEAGPVSSTTIGGLPAKAFTISNTIDTDTAGCEGGALLPLFNAINGNAPATNGGTTQQMWVVDAPARPVLIVVESGPEHHGEVEALLASIHFDP